MITADELAQVMPNLKEARLKKLLPFLQEAMKEFKINTHGREAAFIAQLAHESGELQFMEELADGSDYEGRVDLGNTHPGDGRRFKGRGPIQLTGRHNYTLYGEKLKLNLVENPEQAAKPEVGFRIAGLYWSLNGLNQLADEGDFFQITQRINGGQRGREHRERFHERALRVLSKGDKEFEPGPSLFVNGQPVPDASLSRDGATLVKLRAIAEKGLFRILSTDNDVATIQLPDKSNHQVAMVIIDSNGYVAVRDLPFQIKFDATNKSVSIGNGEPPTVSVASELREAVSNGAWKLISPPDAWRKAIAFDEALIPLVEQLARNYGWVAKVDQVHKKVYVGPSLKTTIPPETKPGEKSKLKVVKEPSSPSDPYFAGEFDKRGPLYRIEGPETLKTPLSEHFVLGEFVCNNPTFRQFVRVHDDLVRMLEEIRSAVGGAINLTNAHRPWPHNASIGGATKSEHIAGTAADIYTDAISNSELHRICDRIIGNKGGVGRYADFVHVDVRGFHARWDG
ncbi:MAG: D-Ala-D-Ala carboxypeptidase family metallohydrolase [Vulcanimicrobiota bacterium]